MFDPTHNQYQIEPRVCFLRAYLLKNFGAENQENKRRQREQKHSAIEVQNRKLCAPIGNSKRIDQYLQTRPLRAACNEQPREAQRKRATEQDGNCVQRCQVF